MKEYTLERSTRIRRPLLEVFEFFSNAENLERLTPPELGFRIRSALPIEMRCGALIDYTIKLYGLPVKWRTEITRWEPPLSFEDTQISGPYAKWVHTHRFVGDGRFTTMEDRVVYALPFGPLGRIAHPLVGRQLKRVFDYRQSVLARLFE
ncbi:MAG: SRPBCC family protein [Gemmatimonadota bacterium]|nr:SRPBCC family protein [Gemmatimonadota bacterium]